MRAHSPSLRGLAACLPLLAAAACHTSASDDRPCVTDADCGPSEQCLLHTCHSLPDLGAGLDGSSGPGGDGGPHPDLIPTGPCEPGFKMCGVSVGSGPCVPASYCCSNNDCAAAGETCQPDGTCACPAGERACGLACRPPAFCCADADCASRRCRLAGTCATASCSDGVVNNTETDSDCGGGFCDRCAAGRACRIDIDCRSNVCQGGVCVDLGFTAAAYGGGHGPAWIHAVDLDGDGRDDLVTANALSENVSVLLGRDGARFASKGTIAVGRSPAFVTSGDLDGDGHPDLVVLDSGDYQAAALLGRGDGSFGPAVRYEVGGTPRGAALGDLDGDGNLDLVVANEASDSVSVLLGRGQGLLSPRQDYALDPGPRAVALADLDRDGKLDVLVAADGQLDVLRNRSLPRALALGPLQRIATSVTTESVAVADFSGDGLADVAVGSLDPGGGRLFRGDGLGGLALLGAFGGTLPLTQLLATDLDGDHRRDLVTPGGAFLSLGNLGFGPPIDLHGFFGPPSIALGDFDRDGRLDLAFPLPLLDNVFVARGLGGGAFAAIAFNDPAIKTDVALVHPSALRLADFDADGRDDLVVADGASDALWVKRAGPGGALLPQAVYPTCIGPRALATADLDEDGHLDVVVACEAGSPAIHRGSASGQLTRVLYDQDHPAPAAQLATQVIAADLDGDNHTDLVFADARDATVLLGRGDLGFRNNDQPLVVKGAGSARTLQAIDFDGEGTLDLIACNGSSVLIFLCKGAAPGIHLGFQLPAAATLPALATAAWATDLDGDRHPDLVVAEAGALRLDVLLNDPGKGPDGLGPATPYLLAGIPAGIAIADLDGDKILDLVSLSTVDRSVSVLRGQGKATFGPLVNHEAGPDPSSFTVGDVDGDGKPDLAIAGTTTIRILLGR